MPERSSGAKHFAPQAMHGAGISYFDASLAGNTGHQANACRAIAGELRRRGLRVDIHGNAAIERALAGELDASPCFRLRPYEQSAVLAQADFFIQALSFGQDLRLAWGRTRSPLCYFNSVLAAHFAAIGRWLCRFPAGNAPWVAIEFGAPSGVGIEGWFRPFADQYRRAAREFRRLDAERVLLFTFDRAASAEYAEILQLPVGVLPAVHGVSPAAQPRRRSADGVLTLGFLGQQRTEKGVELLPMIVNGLRRAGCRDRILIQDGDPAVRGITAKLRKLADGDPLVEFVHGPADAEMWQSLLARTDLAVLPYEPGRYRASYSAIAVEAVGSGIPMVVPRGTTMARLADEYQHGAACFDAWDAGSICDSILKALDEFGRLAKGAFDGRVAWSEKNGAGAFAERLLSFGAPALGLAFDTDGWVAQVGAVERATLSSVLAVRSAGRSLMHAFGGTGLRSP